MSKTRLLKTLLLIGVVPTISGCNFKALSTTESTSNTESSNTSESSSDTGTNNDTPSDNNGDSSSTSNDPKKVIVPAHTLKDTNPPINVNSLGQRVTESVWNSYKYGGESAFNKNYNYTYRAWSLSGESTREQFTKNGYYMKSSAGALYYERKSGSTFYQ